LERLIKKLDVVVAGRTFYLILGIIVLIGLGFRVAYIDADPPMGITRSQDFSTDPFQYVYFAENSVAHGNSNPYHDPRFAQWEKSSENTLAWVVFNLLGTGRTQGNAVGVIFNLAAVWLLALALKNFGSRFGALLFAVIASFDFTLVWFARTPFLEACQNFWLCGAVYLFSRGRDHWLFYASAGLTCAVAAFFGKMIALFMVGSFTATWLLLYFNDPENRKAVQNSAIRFYAGFGAATIVWLVAVYLPSSSQVSGYLSEQAVGLYGAPKALESFSLFIWQFATLVWESELFAKMPVVAILAFLFGAGMLSRFARRPSGKKLFGDFNVGWVILLLWFAVGYLALFPWNYRPLRYQTTLMFPAMAMAGVALAAAYDHLRHRAPTATKAKSPEKLNLNIVVMAALWAIWFLPLLSSILLEVGSDTSGSLANSYLKEPLPYAFVMLLIGGLAALVYKAVGRVSSRLLTFSIVASGVVVVFLIGWNAVKFVSWAGERQYSLVSADRDLGALVNKDAVVSGPYATALTQENRLGCVIHMFGVKKADKDIFTKFPVTHLVMDEGNEKRAREDYPEIMKNANFITRYLIRGIPVRLYCIGGLTGNAQAARYAPTDYERAQGFIAERNDDSATTYLRRYLSSGTPNYSANLYAADGLVSEKKYGDALAFYRKALDFSTRDPMSARGLGTCYLALAADQGNTAYFDSALVYLRIARPLFAQDKTLAEIITNLESRK
jgi:hypothetical protein